MKRDDCTKNLERGTRWFPAGITLGLLLLASTSLSADPVKTVKRIEVLPTSVHLYAGDSKQQVVITGFADAGETGRGDVDLTRTAQFESSAPSIATVTADGIVLAGEKGEAMVRVKVAGHETTFPVTVARAGDKPPLRFVTDIAPLFSKYGCNGGLCHGKATGQNGFMLSLLGFEPDFDYQTAVRGTFARRLSAGNAERSLLMLKATGTMAHGGGPLVKVGSDDHTMFVRWIDGGLSGPHDDDPVIKRVELFPEQRVLEAGSKQQLLVTAYFSNGEVRDVTRQTVFLTNDEKRATVTKNGLVETTALSGLFSVMVRYGSEITVFHGTVPFVDEKNPVPELTSTSPEPSRTVVDAPLFAQWKRLGVGPSNEVSDHRFIRRATLDICGTLPTVDEVNEYVADTRPNKRTLLIDRLIERPEYASYFGLKWADILQNRGKGYSTSKQRRGTSLFSGWIRDSIASNKPYDQFLSEIITATGSQTTSPPTLWYRTVRTTQDYVESISQAFLGVRVQCAQCHHHPFERWSQADYYGLAAVFARVGRKRGFADAEVPTDETIYVKNAGEIRHPRTGKVMKPTPLGGDAFQLTRFEDPRRSLAKWLSAPNNPFVARTMVNRMWGHFLGRGIIDPIDDARSTNPPSNPELLDSLAREFVSSGFDLKHLIRTICNSYAYRLSSDPSAANRDDSQSFARFYPRRLSAEVLLDAISQVTDVPTEFPGGPGKFPKGTRAIDLPDENVPTNFLDVFGRPSRTSACECERTSHASLQQALELVNSTEIHRKLTAEANYPQQLADAKPPAVEAARDIFLRLLSRPPRDEELKAAIEFIETESNPMAGYRSLIWTLLATNEFMFNL